LTVALACSRSAAEGDGILLEMVFLPPKHATSGVVPKRYHNLFEVVPLKKHETKAVKVEKHHEVAQTLYVPIRVSFADDPPMSLPMSPKSVEQ
jgi:hypothetical protein